MVGLEDAIVDIDLSDALEKLLQEAKGIYKDVGGQVGEGRGLKYVKVRTLHKGNGEGIEVGGIVVGIVWLIRPNIQN